MSVAPLAPLAAIDAIVETDRCLLDLLHGLSLDEWEQPTIVPRWRVRHVAGHLLDTALRRLTVVRDGYAAEQPASGAPADIRAFVDRLNAAGVAVYGRLAPGVVAALMRTACADLHVHLRGLDPHAPARFPVSWAGESSSPNWFDTARELTERWHHQQQIRLAVDRPGIMIPALYHPVLACFVRVLPHAYRDTPAAPGTHLEVRVDGPSGGMWRLYRDHDRWRLTADALAGPATCLTIPEAIAWRLFTKGLSRPQMDAQVRVEGDRRLAEPALGAVAIVG